MAFCTKCGAQIEEGATSCIKCGAKVGEPIASLDKRRMGEKRITNSLLPILILIIVIGALVYAYREWHEYRGWRGPDGETVHEYVEINHARLVGAEGNYIELSNNPEAHNPTWRELEQFLRQDTTDQYLYNLTSFVCADFAEMLHNNAEKAGIRAAYVCIDLSSYSEGHALDAFNTTDRGLIYIDDTGTETGSINADKVVNFVNGSEYVPMSIFPNPGYESQWDSLGIVTDIWVQW